MPKFIKKYDVYIIVSLFLSIYATFFVEMRRFYVTKQHTGLLNDTFSVGLVLKILLLFVVILAILLLMDRFKIIFQYIDKYRYIIGLAIIIIVTFLEISGSSMSVLYTFLEHDYTNDSELMSQGVLLGTPRNIRTDEYAVFTPMNFSQGYNDYGATSDILRGAVTDVTTVYANPAFAVATIFRPFLWGYFFLGNAKALAFFWISRMVVLFLVSYEFGKLLTNRNKLLAVSYAGLITFSQTIQWWYSINGLVEMFIFGQLALVLIYELLRVKKLWIKIVIGLGLVMCAGGFLLTLYPAQQILLAYIFGAFLIYMLIKDRKLIDKTFIIIVVGSVVLFALLIFLVISQSMDTIKIFMNTAYPGRKAQSGGDIDIEALIYWVFSIFVPVDEYRMIVSHNVVEQACFYSLFPLGIILPICSMIKKRKGDLLYILLILEELLFIVFSVVGLPDILTTITLLGNCQAHRVYQTVGFIDILLLFRVLSEKKLSADVSSSSYDVTGQDVTNRDMGNVQPIRHRLKYLLLLIIFPIMQILYICGLRTSITLWITMTVITLWIAYLIIGNTAMHREKLAITLLLVISVSGLAVNPVQKGADVVLDSNLVSTIKEIREDDPDALWIVMSEDFQVENIPIMAGAKTINSTNTYPNLELWRSLDKDGKYEDIYNRYAHIHVDIKPGDTEFILNNPDDFTVKVNREDLATMNVSYIMSNKTLDALGYEKVYGDDKYIIYKCEERR